MSNNHSPKLISSRWLIIISLIGLVGFIVTLVIAHILPASNSSQLPVKIHYIVVWEEPIEVGIGKVKSVTKVGLINKLFDSPAAAQEGIEVDSIPGRIYRVYQCRPAMFGS